MFEQLEARRDSNIILPPFRDRLLPDDIGAPYGMIVDRHAYASYQKHLPSVYIQEMPRDTTFLQVSGRNRSGPQQYAASKVDKEVGLLANSLHNTNLIRFGHLMESLRLVINPL
jgi:hypothetical protein